MQLILKLLRVIFIIFFTQINHVKMFHPNFLPSPSVARVAASVANLATLSLDLATFQTPLAPFFFKRLATNLATFGLTIATLQMSPVMSCERVILSYTSPCVCSDQWALAPAERSSTFQWPHGSWHRCEWAAHVQHGVATDQSLGCFSFVWNKTI